MSGAQMSDSLELMGMPVEVFARILRYSPKTLDRWMDGKSPIPDWVALILLPTYNPATDPTGLVAAYRKIVADRLTAAREAERY